MNYKIEQSNTLKQYSKLHFEDFLANQIKSESTLYRNHLPHLLFSLWSNVVKSNHLPYGVLSVRITSESNCQTNNIDMYM